MARTLEIVNLSPNQSMPFKAASQLIDTRTGDAFSFINLQGDEDIFIAREMVNGGKGLNYGVDITFEQFMTHGFYYMATASLFDSRYRTDTGEWYNTRFNRNFAVNLLAGKEWQLGKKRQNMLNVSGRLTLQGGDRYSPIDVAASEQQQEAVYDQSRPYSEQLSPAFIAHMTVSYRINRRKVAHEIALKVLNITGYKDYYGHRYNYVTHKVEAEREAKQKASEHIARETNVFLDVMNQTGVKAMAGVRIKPRIEEKDIDFAAAMSKAGVKPLGDDTRAQHRKVRRPIPVQTIADNKRVLEESMSDDLDSIEFLESEDGKSFRRPGIGPDVPRDLRRGRWSVRAQIDLHGMTVDDARCAVAEFLKNARKQELFCVRIIHGKGNGTPGRIGVLREVVRRWLKQRDEVVAFCEPREIDGGAGATIVRLRALPRRTDGDESETNRTNSAL